jgi:hypothetical protein
VIDTPIQGEVIAALTRLTIDIGDTI